MSGRDAWVPSLQSLGLTRVEIMNLSDREYQEKVNFALECGFAPVDDELSRVLAESIQDQTPEPEPTPAPPPPIKPPRKFQPNLNPDRTESGLARDEQNEEYLEALYLARQKEEMEIQRSKQAAERVKRENEQREKEEREEAQKAEKTRASILSAAAKLPPPPAQGVQIAINCPSKKRIVRKFDKSQKADDVFTFVASQDEFFNGQTPIQFELYQTVGGALLKGKTLESQGITRSTLLNAFLSED